MYFLIFCGLFFCLNTNAQIDKTALLNFINNVRANGCKCGEEKMKKVLPLVWNDTLEQAAFSHAKYMYKTKDFSHIQNDDENNDMMFRVKELGYDANTSGENIYRGPSEPLKVIDAWFNSTGHCNNIMEPIFKEIGIAKMGDYWVMVLASK